MHLSKGSARVKKHVAVVVAYKDSPYLDECLKGLAAQRTDRDDIVCCTSTPSTFIDTICAKYQIKVIVNPAGSKGIGADWNFGLAVAAADWVTLAHQDDIYLPDYLASIRRQIEANPDAAMIVPWFREYADRRPRPLSLTHAVKYLLLKAATRGRSKLTQPKQKLQLLRYGNPIPCGGVALNLRQYPLRFSEVLRFTLDWQAWIELAHKPGDFVMIPKPLMYRRIHKQSATSACTEDGARAEEELAIFSALWPKRIANAIAWFYKLSYLSNRTQS